jgi:acetate kinase
VSILVLNAGSSTLKFASFDADASEAIVEGVVDWNGRGGRSELIVRPRGAAETRSACEAADHGAAAAAVIRALNGPEPEPGATGGAIEAVGHRVVHGGTAFRESVRIDRDVMAEIERLSELAPLHNPPALAAMKAAQDGLGAIPHVAVFDTSFFADLPRAAAVLPVPYAWHTDWGVRKFGFHGISHAYCTGRAAEFLARDVAVLRTVVCHLGNGCSATAVRGGAAVDTTMSFTPLDGLMMGSRSGSVDPGLLLHLLQRGGFDAERLDQALNHESGLLGVSGVSSDFRSVEAAAQQGNDRARLALEIYAARVRSAIGALAASLGGIDVLVFTAGVGEHSATLRAAVCEGLQFLGVHLDPHGNAEARPDVDVATIAATVRILVLRTREELMIARETRRVAGL